jgi:hypothetical protein
MLPNDHLFAYALSHHLRWSWPALSGGAIAFNRNLEQMEPPQLAEALAKFGFSAIWINRAAYADRAAGIIDGFKAAGLTPITQDARETILVLDLAPVRARVKSE